MVTPTNISHIKTTWQIQAQMNRIVRRISQRIGIDPNIVSVRFRYSGDYHDDICIAFNYVKNPFRFLGKRGGKLIGIDKGIFNPEYLGALNIGNLPLRARLQAVIAHEYLEIGLGLTHVQAIQSGGDIPLNISETARKYLRNLARGGDF